MLRGVDDLQEYQKGVLLCRSQIQRASYELHTVGQQHVPFEKKQSAHDEVYISM
jgi:hypothetical protein